MTSKTSAPFYRHFSLVVRSKKRVVMKREVKMFKLWLLTYQTSEVESSTGVNVDIVKKSIQ